MRKGEMKKLLLVSFFLLLTANCGQKKHDSSGDVGRYQCLQNRDGDIKGFLDTKNGRALMFLVVRDSSVVRVIDIKALIEKELSSAKPK